MLENITQVKHQEESSYRPRVTFNCIRLASHNTTRCASSSATHGKGSGQRPRWAPQGRLSRQPASAPRRSSRGWHSQCSPLIAAARTARRAAAWLTEPAVHCGSRQGGAGQAQPTPLFRPPGAAETTSAKGDGKAGGDRLRLLHGQEMRAAAAAARAVLTATNEIGTQTPPLTTTSSRLRRRV